MTDPKPYIGGQAVIEGVMMRAPGCMSVAVRRPDGSLVVREGPMTSRFDHKPWKWPGFRGVAALVESMRIGFGALQFSAEQQMTEEERAAQGAESKGTMVIAMLFAIGLFVVLPQLLASGSGRLFGVDFGLTDARFHWVIGGFKLLIFCVYLALISRVKEIRRTFEYHGAEHKTIHAYEQGLPLTVENVRAQTTLHPRCGTTFLVVVILVSIVAGSLVAPLVLPNASGPLGWAMLLGLRIALLPFISALSFELQRLSARFCTTGPLRVFLLPGFLFQKITTREPDDAQIEVAIAALQAAAWRGEVGPSAPAGDAVLFFPSFERFTEALPSLRSAA
ncbi:MAG: DUF1385 domain-containing protein [Sandaracinaceae bacterium]|jgi:uncharacterized protein YqhQ|nr:DUF1385 domain-containing protein [Sandaracinaceae bacterium]MBP7682031.1 DUF1385 domain-containing protein [Deltaproteobacteria bacterium]MBK7152489.1 DUF1385 domain-containing protein [Sandaracinaceae bacterium]MBK7773714.1 DUF1385 domain-containing protein [Sandaracinaceae bacterium]MBK8412742.1 DUF1385 domain-containing protein [Sandaracinaceae bacterium]